MPDLLTFLGLLYVGMCMPSTTGLREIANELKWIRQELQKISGSSKL